MYRVATRRALGRDSIWFEVGSRLWDLLSLWKALKALKDSKMYIFGKMPMAPREQGTKPSKDPPGSFNRPQEYLFQLT
jgi:hypothetical protein